MARKKSNGNIEKLSAQELYELAKQKEQEELENEREQVKAQIEDLKARRRELVNQQKRELAALDKEIRGLKRSIGAGGARSTRASSNISQAVIDYLGQAGQANTKEIRTALEQAGVETANLGQCLAYLKRKGRVNSPERSVYELT